MLTQKPKPGSRRARRDAPARRATLAICGAGRRPGGRLFFALCDLADRFAAKRDDPLAQRVGVVLTHVALHSARTDEEGDFRLELRSTLDLLAEIDPPEEWSPAFEQDPLDTDASTAKAELSPEWSPALEHDPLDTDARAAQAPLSPGQPTPVPYPLYAGAMLFASAEQV